MFEGEEGSYKSMNESMPHIRVIAHLQQQMLRSKLSLVPLLNSSFSSPLIDTILINEASYISVLIPFNVQNKLSRIFRIPSFAPPTPGLFARTTKILSYTSGAHHEHL